MSQGGARSSRYSPSLTQQTLILIAIPLVFQVIFVLVLTDKIKELERQYAIEAHSTRIITVANSIFVSIIGLSGAESMYRATQQPQFKIDFDSGLKLLATKRKELGDLTVSHTGNDLALRQMLELVDKTIEVLNKARPAFESEDELGIKMAYVEISRIVPRLLAFNDRLVADQQASSQLNLEAQRKAQLDVLVTVYGGLVLNLLLVMLMMLYFKRTTSRRFNVLSNNILAVGKEESLKERLSVGDEISRLDEVVHQVAATLAEARRKRAEAEHAKGQMMAMVTHDLRSPLTSLALSLNLLRSGDVDPASEKADSMLGRAEKSVGQLVGLINDLLDVDRLESGMLSLERSKCRDRELVSEAIGLIDYMAQSREISIESSCVDMELVCDRGRIVRVLTNLLVNAIKFSPPKSTVLVSTRAVEGTSQAGGFQGGSTVADSTAAGWIEFRVGDQGRGIPDDEKERIFDRYTQVQPGDIAEKQGSGLGLAICKVFIAAHGGTIGVESTAGEGSTFYFRLPISTANPH